MADMETEREREKEMERSDPGPSAGPGLGTNKIHLIQVLGLNSPSVVILICKRWVWMEGRRVEGWGGMALVLSLSPWKMLFISR
jgi:hypothetical protein